MISERINTVFYIGSDQIIHVNVPHVIYILCYKYCVYIGQASRMFNININVPHYMYILRYI